MPDKIYLGSLAPNLKEQGIPDPGNQFQKLDDAISGLRFHGVITSNELMVMRTKLSKVIEKHIREYLKEKNS